MSVTKQNKELKIVFVGDAGVGKTCITSRLIKGTYDDCAPATSGGSYASKIIEIPEIGKSLNLGIWDTCKFISIVKFFIKDAKIIVLVYDITRKDSFDNLKNYWYKELNENGPQDVLIGIAGNKSDLYDIEDVSEQEAREFAKSIGAIFCLTSAERNSGIDELVKNLAKKYLELDSSKDEQNGKKSEPKEIKQEARTETNTIKINEKNFVEKNKEQKKKKNSFNKFCLLKYLSF